MLSSVESQIRDSEKKNKTQVCVSLFYYKWSVLDLRIPSCPGGKVLWTMRTCVSQFNYNLDKHRLSFSGHFPHYHFFLWILKICVKLHISRIWLGKRWCVWSLGIREPELCFLFGHLRVQDL